MAARMISGSKGHKLGDHRLRSNNDYYSGTWLPYNGKISTITAILGFQAD